MKSWCWRISFRMCAGLMLVLAVCGSGAWCRFAAADDDNFYSNPSHITDLNWHEGEGPKGDPPPASGGGGNGGPGLTGGGGDDPGSGGEASPGNEAPPCEPVKSAGFASILSFMAWVLSPCHK